MNLRRKKVLITGGSGLLALNWAQAIKENYEVTLGLHQRQLIVEGVECITLDFTSYDSLFGQLRAIAPDIIIHTAGLTSVEGCENDPALALSINTELAATMAKIGVALSAKFIHISTDHLFNGSVPFPFEKTPPQPLNEYARTKLLAEREITAINPDALIIRTNFFGWGPSYRASFSDSILNTIRAGKDIYLFEDVYFTPILIQSLIMATHEILEAGVSGVIHIVGDERISKYEFGRLLAKEFNLDSNNIKPIHFADKPGLTRRPMDLSISNKKVCSLLNRSLGDIPSQLRMLHELESDSSIKTIREL